MAETHDILNGKVHVYRRPESAVWQCSTYLGGENHRKSTGRIDLAEAFVFAADWYIDRLADERVREREHAAAPKNCRTSVEMIEKHYAVHLKDTLDAAAINVRRARPKSG